MIVVLEDGWELAASGPGNCETPQEAAALDWQPATVPGTAAAAVGADGRDFDAEDWWFRVSFASPEGSADDRLILKLDGIATVCEVYLNGEQVLESWSMWAAHAIDVTERLRDENELTIACRALGPLLAKRRRPAARWRSRIVYSSNLRWFRTMMLGRSPDYARGPAPVGPWRPIRLVRVGPADIEQLVVRPRLELDDGIVLVRALTSGAPTRIEATIGEQRTDLEPTGDGWHEGELRVPDAERWWPHTHGQPARHELSVVLDGQPAAQRMVGFRSLTWADDIAADGLDLRVNGVQVFARGALWTPADLISMAPSAEQLRALLTRARDAGMNMLRIVGTGAYESSVFHDLCDELGILVWQDLMFATVDYPLQDPDFRARVEREVDEVTEQLAGRPSFAVLCANHELEQQPAMLGLDPALGHDELWETGLREIVARTGADCAYLPGTPYGKGLSFRSNSGIAHFFAIGGYFGSLPDVRRGEVRFAAECLPFANVPDEVEFPAASPEWKLGVPRDPVGWGVGNGWDFDDVRDFYLEQLFGVDANELRRTDQSRYLDLSKAVSGELMAEVIGEWRRAGSPCRGALVLWFKDMLPGAGFGVLDHTGEPKVSYHYLRRAFAPVAVWTTDEGLNGVDVHAVNDHGEPLSARLRVALYKDFETLVAEAAEDVVLAPRSSIRRSVEGILGRFVDAAYAYHFGPPAHDAVIVSLESADNSGMKHSQFFRFPAGWPLRRESAAQMGLEAFAQGGDDGSFAVTVRTRRLAYCVRVHAPGFIPDDDAFSVEPGGERVIRLRPREPAADFGRASLTAVNLDGPVNVGT